MTEKGSPKIFNGENEIKDVSAIIPRIGASVSFYGGSIVRQFETQGVFKTLITLLFKIKRQIKISTSLGRERNRYSQNSFCSSSK